MSTKIVVFKMNKLVKIGALVLAAAVVTLICLLLISKGSSKATYNPGTYTSSIVLNSNPVTVSVTVTKDEIADISLSSLNETQAVFYPLFEPTMYEIADSVIEMQSTDIALDTENSATAEILLSAIDKALEKAQKQ
jgi:uncharacterized protein with FMN-binding domain